MSGDRVEGVAVLNRHSKPETLTILCRKSDGGCLSQTIPVQRRGTPGSGWFYEERGNELDCQPSVKVTTTRPVGDRMEPVELFHNGFYWSVKFIEATSAESAYGQFTAANAHHLHARD